MLKVYVIRSNIDHFRALLRQPLGVCQRNTVEMLLAEEEGKLKQALAPLGSTVSATHRAP